MARIKNINDKWGDPVEFEASTLDDAVFEMAQALVACGSEVSLGLTRDELASKLQENLDYEIVDEGSEPK